MTIHGNDVLEPEELAELCATFDDAWTATGRSAQSEESLPERTRLASILLRLFKLRQLSPDQAKQTALRIFRQASDPPSRIEVAGVPHAAAKSPRVANVGSAVR